MADLRPATVAVGHGSAPFAANRRQPTDKGVVFGADPKGPVDHDVPVLMVAGADGKPRAVVFGYACHNTTFGADCRCSCSTAITPASPRSKSRRLCPATPRCFSPGAAAIRTRNPASGMKWPRPGHGKTLADEVRRVLAGKLQPVPPAIRTVYEDVKLDLVPRRFRATSRRRRRARMASPPPRQTVLADIDAGRPIWQVHEPVQVVRLGDRLAIVALGGEPVVDYSLRLKRECPQTDLIVAGYSNDVMCYIPSRRVLKEGGYEAVESMIYSGYPGAIVEGSRGNADRGLSPASRRRRARTRFKIGCTFVGAAVVLPHPGVAVQLPPQQTEEMNLAGQQDDS